MSKTTRNSIVFLFFSILVVTLTIFSLRSQSHHPLLPEKLYQGGLQQVVVSVFLPKASHEKTIDFTDFNRKELHVKQPVIHGDKKDGVVELTGKNFSSFIAKEKYVMVNFYSPSCYWSRKLAPEFAAAANLLKGKVAFAKVDASVETDLAWKYEVRGYPTVFLLVGGVRKPYYYERTRDGIVSWVKNNTVGVRM